MEKERRNVLAKVRKELNSLQFSVLIIYVDFVVIFTDIFFKFVGCFNEIRSIRPEGGYWLLMLVFTGLLCFRYRQGTDYPAYEGIFYFIAGGQL